jgi:hypothetical protein
MGQSVINKGATHQLAFCSTCSQTTNGSMELGTCERCPHKQGANLAEGNNVVCKIGLDFQYWKQPEVLLIA